MAGIYFGDTPDYPPLAAGQLVELEGEVSAGEFAPIVTPSRIEILGAGTFPATKPHSWRARRCSTLRTISQRR